jgi:hypothetical protein
VARLPAFSHAPLCSPDMCRSPFSPSAVWRRVFGVSVVRSPPLVPKGFDFENYIVLDDLGKLGRVYREVDEDHADKATVIRDISEGQYSNPVRVVAFNTAEGWSRDVTEDIAREILDHAHRKAEPLSKSAQAFVEWATGDEVPANLMDRS